MAPSTRSVTNNSFIGKHCALPLNQLSTVRNVLCLFEFKKKMKDNSKLTKCVKSEIISEMVVEITYNWKRAAIPTTTKENIFKMVHRLIQKFENVQRHFNSKRKNESLECRNFNQLIDKLFDVCSCTCYKPNSIAIKVIDFDSVDYSECRCDRKISPDELSFYLDQKSIRLLFISNNVDLAGSVEMRRKLQIVERKQLRQNELELTKGINETTSPSPRPSQINDMVVESNRENVNIKQNL